MENWYIGELSPLELYDFGGGNVVAPVPDIGTDERKLFDLPHSSLITRAC